MKSKYLGILTESIANHWEIPEHKNKPILVFEDRIQHVIDNHLKDFGSKEQIEYIYNNLKNIISKPDYVFYNKSSRSLEYYKKLANNVCVAIRINYGKVLKVKSWYPVKDIKIENRKKKEELIKGEEFL